MIRIVICDDQSLIRDGLEMLLKLEEGMEVLGKASDGAEALEMVENYKPDLVLMDLKMAGMNGIEATRRLKQDYPGVKVLVLTTYNDDEWLFDALNAGASGYLLKDTPREEVIKAVKGTVEGNSYLDPSIAGKVMREARGSKAPSGLALPQGLTKREGEVLRLIGQGKNNSEIAAELFLSEGTVRNHISVIFGKIGVNDRTQAAIYAVKRGLDEVK
ncbi:MAG: response regulator transcription factor [Spirochaetales bacterium]|nr:response regulator transcription factor [Spirochaetales bacterium]